MTLCSLVVENLQLTKAVLCAGLYPNVATMVFIGGARPRRKRSLSCCVVL